MSDLAVTHRDPRTGSVGARRNAKEVIVPVFFILLLLFLIGSPGPE